MNLLVDATQLGIPSKRRLEISPGFSDIPSLRASIAFELGLQSVEEPNTHVEVWDEAFEEWCLLTDIKQVPEKAKVRIVRSDPDPLQKLNSTPVANTATNFREGASTMPPSDSGQPPQISKQQRTGKALIEVPQYAVGFGMDMKFVEDIHQSGGLRPLELHGMLSPQEYTQCIKAINDTTRPARATAIDGALLASGAAMLPLIPYALRHKARRKKYKTRLMTAIEEFNLTHPTLVMRWLKAPVSKLVIGWREEAPGTAAAAGGGGGGDTAASDVGMGGAMRPPPSSAGPAGAPGPSVGSSGLGALPPPAPEARSGNGASAGGGSPAFGAQQTDSLLDFGASDHV